MDRHSADRSTVFLIGAGFSVDAASEAGHPNASSSGLKAHYPLTSELLDRCFGIATLPPNKSIEDMFQESIERGNHQPFKVLCDIIMEADYYITPHLKGGNNAYTRFLEEFPESPLLTFNYDSLPEILLLAVRSWCPVDGYGIPVEAGQITIRRGLQPVTKSRRTVLHLHGSLCVYAKTFYIEKSHNSGPNMLRFDCAPQFQFSPDEISHCFLPFEGVPPGMGYQLPPERVIAPTPDKAEGLKGEFIKAVYNRAIAALTEADQVIAIGYSFNPHDHSSYAKLLHAVRGKEVLLVGPDARELAQRLHAEHSDIAWHAEPRSFRDWVNSDYPGVDK